MLDAAVGQLNRQLQSSPPKRSNLSADDPVTADMPSRWSPSVR